MFHQLGRLSACNPWKVCGFWILLGVAFTFAAPHWDTRTQDDDISFIPDRFTSVRAYHLLQKAFPQEVFASRLVFAVERPDAPLTEADFTFVDQLLHDLEAFKNEHPELKLGKIDSYQDGLTGFRFTSNDGQCTLVQVSLESPFLALATLNSVNQVEEVVRARLAKSGIEGLNIHTTGAAGIGRDLTQVAGNSLHATTLATIVLVIVVLMLVYRAPLLALIPLLTIAVSVWVALDLLALMTLLPGVHLVNISKIFAIVILYGAGTDYCLFLISRYREELEAGYETKEALARAVGGVGEALAASAGTVMVGLGLMALAEFAKVRYAGPAIALSLGVALVASMTLTPALLRLLGPRAFWPLKPPSPQTEQQKIPSRCLWESISHFVARKPVLVWCVSVIILLPLVAVGIRVEPNYRATGELSPNTGSLQGLAAIQRHFRAGEIGPITVLLTSDKDWSTIEGRIQIDHLSRGFENLPNVAEVRSMTQPLGNPLPTMPVLDDPENFLQRVYVLVQPYFEDFFEKIQERAQQVYVARIDGPKYVTRLDVVLNSDPFEPESNETLRLIKTWLNRELPRTNLLGSPIQSECYGITSNAQDLADVTESDRHRINCLVIGAIALILLILVRTVWLACYLLATVLASYYAALGATVLAGILWTGAPLPHVDWRVPFFLFTILVAVGEDYNILLVNRALQERKRYGACEGMRRALAKTGGAITSCGLIMAGTFATLMLAGLNTLLQVGFALAFGVLIDTFLVRPFLVPAFALFCWGKERPRIQLADLDDEDPGDVTILGPELPRAA